MRRYQVKKKKSYYHCTTMGLWPAEAHYDEYYFNCCWFFHWPSSTGPSLRRVVVLYAIL